MKSLMGSLSVARNDVKHLGSRSQLFTFNVHCVSLILPDKTECFAKFRFGSVPYEF